MEQVIQLPGAGELRRNWGWFLVLGIVLIVLGTIALRLGARDDHHFGIFLRLDSYRRRSPRSRACFLARKEMGRLFSRFTDGLLYVVAGWMMVTNPGESAVLLTLVIAMFLVFEGVFRIVAAIAARYPHWGWVLFNGVISLILGVMIWRQWPYSGLWVIGLFVGIEMLLNGWSLVMLSLSARNLPDEVPADRGPLRPQAA